MPHPAFDDLASAFALLTRLPVPAHRPQGARSAWAWPVVGAVVGGIAAAVAWGGTAVGLPPGPCAALVLAAQALMTGALHEDGLADTADGLMGGRTRERRLEIMKDSRIGSFGALALVLVTLARWSALAALIGVGGFAAIIAAAALSRAPMALLMAALPNARPSGLSHHVGRPSGGTAALACALALAIGLLTTGTGALLMALYAAPLILALAWAARARIGGQTGDILGASQQLTEAAALTAVATLIP